MQKWEDIVAPLREVDLNALPGTWAPTTIYRPFELIQDPLETKLIVLGQDPYHTPGLATGLAFGVPNSSKKLPPSLKNIIKKYGTNDITLAEWADAGVLLINTALTVEMGKPNSHAKYWREPLKEMLKRLIKYFNSEDHAVHFVLWGKKAIDLHRKLCSDEDIHTFCASSHPSPLSCTRPIGSFPAFTTPCALPHCPCRILSSKTPVTYLCRNRPAQGSAEN